MIFKNKVKIQNNKVIKRTSKSLIELYNIFKETSFNNYPEVIRIDENTLETKYIKEIKYKELIKGTELIKTVSNLHKSTLDIIDVSKNKYKKIYNKLMGNIEYLNEYYNSLVDEIEYKEYNSPSEYLFIRNYSVILSTLKYSKETLKKWFKIVETKSKDRVSIIHNNLSLNHFIKGENNYLISFDNYKVDTLILDLYKFYINDGYKLEFKKLIDIYEENMKLTEEEKLLFNILITIPPKLVFKRNEYQNTIYIKDNFSYIYSSLNLAIENK